MTSRPIPIGNGLVVNLLNINYNTTIIEGGSLFMMIIQ